MCSQQTQRHFTEWAGVINLVSVLLVERIRFGYFVLAGFKKHTGPFVLKQRGAALALVHHRHCVRLLQALLLTCSSLEIAKIKGMFLPKVRLLSLLPIKRNAGFYCGVCTWLFQKFYVLSVVGLQGVCLYIMVPGCLVLEFWFISESSLISEEDLVQLNVEKSACGKDLVWLSCLEGHFCY